MPKAVLQTKNIQLGIDLPFLLQLFDIPPVQTPGEQETTKIA